MKRIMLLTALAGILFSSCSEKASESEGTEEQQETAMVEANAEASMAIDGMVCAVGCAASIERKLNETEGVANAEVDFETGMATIAYNTDYTDETKLTALIEGMNDGQYAVLAEGAKKEMTEEEIAECKKKCAAEGKECSHGHASAEGKCSADCKKACCAGKHIEGETEEASVETESETVEA